MSGMLRFCHALHGRTFQALSRRRRQIGITLFFLPFAISCSRGGSRDEGAPLTAALASVRPGEARLVGAPHIRPTPSESIRSGTTAVRQALAATGADLTQGSAESLWDDGVAHLLAGESDIAITEISKATKISSKDARFWSDLAAAHLQRGSFHSDPYELVLALSAANRAVFLDSSLLSARFNRALALGRLALREREKADWDFVASREPDPLWRREARDHATALANLPLPPDWKDQKDTVESAVAQGSPKRIRATVPGSQQRFREYLEEELLEDWAMARHLRNISEATHKLAIAQATADALVASGGDQMAADTIDHIVRLETTNPEAFQKLVAGFAAYSEGLALAGEDPEGAKARFEKSRRLLAHQGSPFTSWAIYRIAWCEYQSASYQQARRHLLQLTRDSKIQPYQALVGRAYHLTGLIDGLEGRPSAANKAFEASEKALRRVREAPNAAKARALQAQTLDILGQRPDAWRRLQPALVEPSLAGRNETRAVVFECASELAYGEGDIEFAFWFGEEVVHSLDAMNRPDLLLPPLCKQASLLTLLGRTDEASQTLTRARQIFAEVPDSAYRRTLEGDLLLAEAEVAGKTSPQQAITKLDRAIPVFHKTSYHYRIGHALYLRAMAQKALGQNEAAERDLTDAIGELERQRETISDPRDRISYLDRLEGLFDSMIRLQLDQRKQPEAALRFSEQAKARVLWDWILTSPSQQAVPADLRQAAAPLDLAALRASLPEGTAAVEYSALPGRLVVWVVHREGEVQYEPVSTSTAALESLVQQFRRALLDHDSGSLEKISGQLYDLLIRPVSRHLGRGERLVLIPDGPLHALPFSLLRDSRSGNYLVQDHALAVSPSLRVYVASRRRDALLAGGKRQALIVAAPDFDRGIDPTLLPLRSGETDAAIAKNFPGSRVIGEGKATREAFLKAAGDFEILHFGGHSVVNPESPLLSQMLFAKNPADPSRGVLYAGDVLRQKFPRTRLMVLASCGTASGRISRTEGVESLARPFLATGVPTVVASLWSVNDQPTADFFNLFYRKLAQRFDPAGALQAAQVELIERKEGPAAKPWTWGAFEVIGGGVPEGPR
jgi:CHAT domain-containing protein